MNSHALNSAAMDGSVTAAIVLLPSSSVSMTFTASERNVQTMAAALTLNFTTVGGISAGLTMTAAVLALTFAVNGDGMVNNAFLIGNVGMTFAGTAALTRGLFLAGATDVALTNAGVLSNQQPLGGAVAVALDMTGGMNAIQRMVGAASVSFTNTGDLNLNASDSDVATRTFRRAFTQRDFKRS